MRGIYKFSKYFGRMGGLEGVFVADSADIAGIIGRTVHFGEVLGKHSDVSSEVEAKDFTLLTDDQDFIAKAISYGLGFTGTNPFGYLEENE